MAFRALFLKLEHELFLAAKSCVFERDRHPYLDVAAIFWLIGVRRPPALLPLTPSSAKAKAEVIIKAAHSSKHASMPSHELVDVDRPRAEPAHLRAVMAKLVILGTLALVAQHFICFSDFFELLLSGFLLCFGLSSLHVWMPFPRKLPESRLYLAFRSAFAYAEDIIVVSSHLFHA